MTTKAAETMEDAPGEEASEEFGPRFETKKFVLQGLLDKVASTLPSNDVLPVLKNFLFEVTPGRLRVISTDLELSAIAETEMVVTKRSGTAVFPGRRLLDIVKEAEDGELLADVTEDGAHLAVKRTTWNLKLTDPEEYPALPEMEDIEFHTVNRNKFVAAINSVRYAASTETVRPSLMLLDITNGRMRASDGVRFQEARVQNWPEHFDIQIPIMAVDNLVKLLSTTEIESIEIGESENHLVFRIGSDSFIANKLTAEFPDMDEILLKPALANEQKLSVDREELISAIKRVRVTADPETSAVVIALSDATLRLQSRDKFGNEAEETLDAYWESGDREVAFNHTHLLDMLNMTDVRSCEFRLGPNVKTRPSPILLEDEANGSIGVLNQIRVDFLQ